VSLEFTNLCPIFPANQSAGWATTLLAIPNVPVLLLDLDFGYYKKCFIFVLSSRKRSLEYLKIDHDIFIVHNYKFFIH